MGGDTVDDGAVSEERVSHPGSWSVVVLTGGSSTRMGRDKASLEVAGMTLLQRTLVGIPRFVPIVVVGPTVPVARTVDFCREEPVGGGPVAGIDAGLALVHTPVVVVLAADLPFVGALPTRLAAALDVESEDVEAVIALDGEARLQQLCAAYRTTALRRAIAAGGAPSGASMRSVVERLTVITVDAGAGDAVRDVDTPADLAAVRATLEESRHDDDRRAADGDSTVNHDRGGHMDEWIEALARVLDLPADVDVPAVLDVAKDVAHNVERKAAPVSTFLLGVAVGGGMPASVAVERAHELAVGWSAGSV